MNIKKYQLLFLTLLLLLPLKVGAIIGQEGLDTAASTAGFGTETDVYVIATRWINGFLSIFMMVFTYFIISAGFTWMTSGGNTEKVLAAKTTIKNAFLGLVIALTAYALARYVILALYRTTYP